MSGESLSCECTLPCLEMQVPCRLSLQPNASVELGGGGRVAGLLLCHWAGLACHSILLSCNKLEMISSVVLLTPATTHANRKVRNFSPSIEHIYNLKENSLLNSRLER